MTDRPLDADVAPGTEWAERGPDFERRVGEPSGVRNRPDPAAVDRADQDLVVGEVDKDGHGSGTVVAAGDTIPPDWLSFPAARPGGHHAARSSPWAGGTAGSGPGCRTVTP